MDDAAQALEFDRLLCLVAAFSRCELGRAKVLATVPRPTPEEREEVWAQTAAVERFLAAHGPLALPGLDAVAELDRLDPSLPALIGLVRTLVEARRHLGQGVGLAPHIAATFAALPALEPLLGYLNQRIGAEGEVLDSASPALAAARQARERHRKAIVGRLEQLRQEMGLSGPYTVRRERYCLPVPLAERSRLPGLLLDVSASGATAYVEPLAVVDLNNALAEATALARAEEERVRQEVLATLRRRREELQQAADLLAQLDAAQARVYFGRAAGGTLVRPGGEGPLLLRGARHPLLAPELAPLRQQCLGFAGNTAPVVPLDFEPPPGIRLVLLSGPNAGGKTVALKTLGLAVLMAYAGIPVLAQAGSRIPHFARVWCHIGDEQNLLADLSTFSAAMAATARLLQEADPGTLVLYDELGSGTDPEEGAALAAALLEELLRRHCFTVATAHLTTVAAHLEGLSGAANAAMGFDPRRGSPTFCLAFGAPGRSHGLAIARRSGVPEAVLARARTLLSRGFLAIDTYLHRLEGERRALAEERERLAREVEQARQARRAVEDEREAWRRERAELRERLEAERERLRQRARQQLERVLEELRQAREQHEHLGRRRLAALRSAALDVGESPQEPSEGPDLLPGATVRLAGTRSLGEVLQVTGERVQLQVGGKRLWVERRACEPTAPPPPAARVQAEVAPAAQAPPQELKLIGMTTEEARAALERFLDHALLAGSKSVRIVHGHGSGALRRLTRETLGQHPAVVRFSHPAQALGGTGVTVAELE